MAGWGRGVCRYRDLLETKAFATAAEKRKAAQKAAVRAAKKKDEEAAMVRPAPIYQPTFIAETFLTRVALAGWT